LITRFFFHLRGWNISSNTLLCPATVALISHHFVAATLPTLLAVSAVEYRCFIPIACFSPHRTCCAATTNIICPHPQVTSSRVRTSAQSSFIDACLLEWLTHLCFAMTVHVQEADPGYMDLPAPGGYMDVDGEQGETDTF
jgi:hypothetical protein